MRSATCSGGTAIRANRSAAWQLLLIGDLQQLAPVVRDEEWSLLGRFYASPFFFESRALKETSYVCIELQHIYRQSDERFITMLNAVRESRVDPAMLEELNRRYRPAFDPDEKDGYITLTSHNHTAHGINEAKMAALPARPVLTRRRWKERFRNTFIRPMRR